MQTIYKYLLEIEDKTELSMPVGAKVLCVQTQRDIPTLWALVDLDSTTNSIRLFETFGTGHTLVQDMGVERKYVGTYQIHNGSLVFHVFERL